MRWQTVQVNMKWLNQWTSVRKSRYGDGLMDSVLDFELPPVRLYPLAALHVCAYRRI